MYDPNETLRTEWKVKNNSELFDRLKESVPVFGEDELSQLEKSFQDNKIEYFEAAWYPDGLAPEKDEDIPSGTFVFKGRRLFLDINFPYQKKEVIKAFSDLAGDSVKFVKDRKISKKEIFERVVALNGDEFEYPELESDGLMDWDDSSEDIIDDRGVLNRSAFYIIAKQPALDWAQKCEDHFHKGPTPKLKWTLEQLNEEPLTVLGPVGIEIFADEYRRAAFSKLKQDAFEEFLMSLYTDGSYWPDTLDEKTFDEWFDLKRLGIVLDSESLY